MTPAPCSTSSARRAGNWSAITPAAREHGRRAVLAQAAVRQLRTAPPQPRTTSSRTTIPFRPAAQKSGYEPKSSGSTSPAERRWDTTAPVPVSSSPSATTRPSRRIRPLVLLSGGPDDPPRLAAARVECQAAVGLHLDGAAELGAGAGERGVGRLARHAEAAFAAGVATAREEQRDRHDRAPGAHRRPLRLVVPPYGCRRFEHTCDSGSCAGRGRDGTGLMERRCRRAGRRRCVRRAPRTGSGPRPPGCSTSARRTTGCTTCCAAPAGAGPVRRAPRAGRHRGGPARAGHRPRRPAGRGRPRDDRGRAGAYEREGARLVRTQRAWGWWRRRCAARWPGFAAPDGCQAAARDEWPAVARGSGVARTEGPAACAARSSGAPDLGQLARSCRPRRGDPRLPDHLSVADRRPPRPQPRCGRADPGPAPGLRLAARPDPVRHRPPGLRAQDRHRPRRTASTRCASAGGLSGYPSRAETSTTSIENSHASTALSYADGLAKAFAAARRATGTSSRWSATAR